MWLLRVFALPVDYVLGVCWMSGQCSSQVNVETGLFYVVIPTFSHHVTVKWLKKNLICFKLIYWYFLNQTFAVATVTAYLPWLWNHGGHDSHVCSSRSLLFVTQTPKVTLNLFVIVVCKGDKMDRARETRKAYKTIVGKPDGRNDMRESERWY